jgi:hypothetical protein
MKYGYYDGKGWVTTIIDAKGYPGKGNSITLGQGQAPIVTYIANDGLRIARWYKGKWGTEVIDPEGWAAGDRSIVIDRAGVIHIAYLTIPFGTPSKLMYVRIADSARKFEIISNREFVPPKRRKDVSIAVSPDGLPFVSFTSSGPSGGLKVYRKSDSKWAFDSTIAGREVGLDTSIAIDNGGKVHVSYFSGPALTYAFFDGKAWFEETVDYNKVQSVGLSNSLAVSANGVPHIAFLGADADLKYANRLGGKWHVETVAPIYLTTTVLKTPLSTLV